VRKRGANACAIKTLHSPLSKKKNTGKNEREKERLGGKKASGIGREVAGQSKKGT